MDEIDKNIVKNLQKNACIRVSAIARKLELANATVHARIIKLRKKNIISGFTALVDPVALGKSVTFLLSISVDHERDRVGETLKQIMKMPDAVSAWCVSGEWDYHILYHTRNVSTMKDIITRDIKGLVPHIIRGNTQMILDQASKPIELD